MDDAVLDNIPEGLPKPKRYIETLVGAGQYLYAVCLSLAFLLELIGPMAVLITAQSSAARLLTTRRYYSGAAMLSLAWMSRQVLSLWLRSEALFYIICCALATRANHNPGAIGAAPFSQQGTLEWRQEIWRRILRDPSQSSRDFVEGWMFRQADEVRDTPLQMLLGWLAARLTPAAAQTKPTEPQPPVAGRALVEPYGVPYDELSRADVEYWLCRSLFGKLRCADLGADEAAELAGYCDELEAAVREDGRFRGGAAFLRNVSSYVGAVVSNSSSTVQRVVARPRRAAATTGGTTGTTDATASAAAVADSAPVDAPVDAPTPKPAQLVGPPSPGGDVEPSISSYCGAMDALQWRHRPLLFYGLTHAIAHGVTPMLMQRRGFSRRSVGELTYWYRAGRRQAAGKAAGKAGEAGEAREAGKSGGGGKAGADDSGAAGGASEALVFIHGIGFGCAPYIERVCELAAAVDATSIAEADILMIELPAASQRAFSRMPPPAERFAALLDEALESLGLRRVVVVGHSLGSVYATYVARWDAMREEAGRGKVGAVALIDPIAVNLHHARSTREVMFTRLDSAQASFEDFLFKKELWTAILIARHVPWHKAAYWLDDCVAHRPTLIAVGSLDTIVDPIAARQGFGSWKARRKGVRVLTMEGMGHGGWLTSDPAAEKLSAAVAALRIESASTVAADEFELTW